MIDWNTRRVFVMVAVLAGWWTAPALSQEARAMMRWKNGDILVGKLIEGRSGRIHWSCPVFTSALVVDTQALESIVFTGVTEQPTEAFRIATVAGDVFVADLVGSDEKTFHLSSKRYGRVQVNRDAIHWVKRRVHPNLIFDGSRISSWDVDLDGPVKESTYTLYAGDWVDEDEDGFPLWSQLSPIEIGRLPNGYLDVDLPKFRERFAIRFEGRIDITKAGEYYVGLSADQKARLFIDGQWVTQADAADVAREELELVIETENRPKVTLRSGPHALRVEYFNNAGHTRLNAWISGPDTSYLSFDGINKVPGWHGGPGGRPQSRRKKAGLSQKIRLPKQFEIDLELMSSTSPEFVLALGSQAGDIVSNRSLRLETWDDELVVVQDTVFEPVLAIAQGRGRVHLRLVCDSDLGQLQVFDSNGDRLVCVDGIQLPTGEAVIHLRNLGEHLAVRRLRIYPRSQERPGQRVDLVKSRVRLVNGQVIYGRLMLADDGAYVVDRDGTRRGIDLDEVDRISGTDGQWDATTKTAELLYADGEAVGGLIERVHSDRVVLRTAFSEAPVTCTLVGASSLRFGPPAENRSPGRRSDPLFCAGGQLHGQLSFDLAGSPLSWRAEDDAPPVGLAVTGGARIERNNRVIAKDPFIDENAFPSVLHLRNGESIPCRVTSYDRDSLGFQSPFLKRRKIDSGQVKAIEFKPVEKRGSSHAMDDWLRTRLGTEPETAGAIDPIKLDHALTLPRLQRGSPPTHILVARNGDLMRGRLLGISASSVHFESKRRKQMIPIDSRLALVVCVSEPDGNGGPLRNANDLTHSVRARLTQGSILMFDPLATRDGRLVGRSAIYGEVAVPVAGIQELILGGFRQGPCQSRFKAWVVHPARKP